MVGPAGQQPAGHPPNEEDWRPPILTREAEGKGTTAKFLVDYRRLMSDTSEDVTELLHDWGQGDPSALERLIPLVFEDLRRIASHMFQRENDGHTLQPTALVSEVYFRLIDQRNVQWQNRQQFFSVAALMMRRILVDYAKQRQAAKRGSNVPRVPLDEALQVPDMQNVDMADLDEALTRLAKLDLRQSRVVELRFFMGLDNEEIAEVLEISPTTVKREWRLAKLWLLHELKK